MAKKNAKKAVKDINTNKYQHTMKTVTSETCIACKTPCARGMAYAEKMAVPGAVGKGVACHLTKGKGMK